MTPEVWEGTIAVISDTGENIFRKREHKDNFLDRSLVCKKYAFCGDHKYTFNCMTKGTFEFLLPRL